MNSITLSDDIYNLSLFNLNDPENNEIRITVNKIDYLGKISKSKICLINKIIQDEINKNLSSFHTFNNEILKAIKNLPITKYRNGDGRKAEWIAKQYKISMSTVYQAQKVLRDAPPGILRKVRSGEMPFKTAYKLVKKLENKKT